MAASRSVDDYLLQVPASARAVLLNLRKTIKETAPDASETISYQMPTFRYKGRALVGFAAFKNHCSFFPYSSTILDAYDEELGSLRTSKGTVRFSVDEPLSPGLVKKIVKARIKEIDSKTK